MASVLIIGYDPDTVDFSDPGPPPGMNPEKLWAGTAESLKRIEDHGWEAAQCLVPPDNTAIAQVEAALSKTAYDCIVIGGGIRMTEKSVPIFEKILDVIRRVAPAVPIAFNTAPDTSLEAAQRWITE